MPATFLFSPASPAASQVQNVISNDVNGQTNLVAGNPPAAVVNPGRTNFTINNLPGGKLPGFLTGMVVASIASGYNPIYNQPNAPQSPNTLPVNCEAIVEIETAPNEWIPLYLTDPEKPKSADSGLGGENSSDGGGDWSLKGLGKSGFARTAAARNVRIRRVDPYGGQVYMSLEFRESY